MRLQGFNAQKKREKREQEEEKKRDKINNAEIAKLERLQNDLIDLENNSQSIEKDSIGIRSQSSRKSKLSSGRNGVPRQSQRASHSQPGSRQSILLQGGFSSMKHQKTPGENMDKALQMFGGLDDSQRQSSEFEQQNSKLESSGNILLGVIGEKSAEKGQRHTIAPGKGLAGMMAGALGGALGGGIQQHTLVTENSNGAKQENSNGIIYEGSVSSEQESVHSSEKAPIEQKLGTITPEPEMDQTYELSKSKIVMMNNKKIILNPGELRVGNRIIKRVPNAIYCLTNNNQVRITAAQVSEHRAFDTIIIFFILANCICMAVRDYMDQDDKTVRNQILNQIDYVFSVVFIIEALLKILTSGFIFGKKTYLRDPWNVIDFLIVNAAILDFVMTVIDVQTESLSALKSIRVLRVLRPLKAVKTLKSLRKQTSALLLSVKQLVNVMAFLVAMFVLCGVMGLQLFMESIHYACRQTEEPLSGATEWPLTDKSDVRLICAADGVNAWDSYNGRQCPEGSFCGSPIDFGLEQDKEIAYSLELQYGFGIFSNIADSIFAVFQVITLDNWSQIMYNMAWHESFFLPSLFCSLIVFVGSFFMLNLMLAVIMDAYDQSSVQADEIQQQQFEQEKRDIEDRIAKVESMHEYEELNQLLLNRQKRLMDHFADKFKKQIARIQTGDQSSQSNKDVILDNSSQQMVEQSNDSRSNKQDNSSQDNFSELDRQLLRGQTTTAKYNSNPANSVMSNLGGAFLGKLGGGVGAATPVAPTATPTTKPKNQSSKRSSTSSKPAAHNGSSSISGNSSRSKASKANSNSGAQSENSNHSVEQEINEEMKIVQIQEQQSNLLAHSHSMIQPRRSSNMLMNSLKLGLTNMVQKKQSELQTIGSRAMSLTEPEAQSALSGLHSRAMAAVNLATVKDKELASDQIRLEGNIMMLRFGEALKTKYLTKRHGNTYGLKDEGNTIQVLRNNISNSLDGYKRSMTKQPTQAQIVEDNAVPVMSKKQSMPEPAASTNPLAAIFAFAAKKKEDEEDQIRKENGLGDPNIDLSVQKSLGKGKLNSINQIKLVMDIKSQVEKQFKQKEILAKMALHLKNIVLERNEMQEIIEDTDALLDLDIRELRAQNNFLYRKCHEIEQSKYFTLFISMCIIANTIVLSLDSYPTDIKLLIFIEWANLVFFMTFLLEMIVKMLGLGFKIYFKDSANFFDFIVIVLSIADIVTLYMTSSLDASGVKAIQVLRVFRLLRVFKLAKIWPSFAYILVTVGNTFRKISAFSVLLLIFIFSFAILGSELFAAKCSFDENDKPILDDYANGLDNVRGRIPDSNFNNFFDSMLSVFIVLANDGWSTIYFDHARVFREAGQSTFLPTVFFIMLIIIGQNVLFQLFLAILLQEFDERSLINEENERKQKIKNKDEKSLWKQIQEKLFKSCGKKKKDEGEEFDIDSKKLNQTEGNTPIGNQTEDLLVQNRDGVGETVVERQPTEPAVIDDQQGGGRSQSVESESRKDSVIEEPQKQPEDSKSPKATPEKQDQKGNRSLFLFASDNKIRQKMRQLEKSKYFKNGILFLIVISSITLAFENPLTDPDSTEFRILEITDMFMTTIFGLEVIIKVISVGFICNGPKSYMRKFWNILDFCVVLIAIVSLSIPSGSANLGTLKILRMGRLFRPLRVLSRNEGLRISIQALVVAIPAMTKLLLIVGLFFIIFAIMGITLFKGSFEICNTSSANLTPNIIKLINDEYSCINYGGVWETYYKNFNDLGTALMQTVTMSQTVGWAELMYRAINSVGPGKTADSSNKSYFSALYFIFYIIFGAFFITNLFVGIVISTYNREKDRLGNNFLLSDDQKKWIETKLLVVRVNPKRINRRPENSFRSKMFSISENSVFDWFILICITLNAIVMSMVHLGITSDFNLALTIANYFFTGIFFFEMVIRLIAYGKNYFRDAWNVFDFTIVIGSSIFIGISIFGKGSNLTTFVTAARLLRIGRLLRLFRQMKSLQMIFSTFLSTLPHMLNVGGIMILIIYIYSVIGISLFAEVKPNGGMHRFLGFQGFYKSFITLIRIATGENWNQLMNSLSRINSEDFVCIDNPTYEDFKNADFKPQGCGNPFLAQVFFITYIFLVGLIFLNLFIAIILQGYYQATEMEKQVVNSEIMHKYRDAWAQFDQDATGFMEANRFSDLMLAFGPPLGWDHTFLNKPTKQALFFRLISQNMKTYSNHTQIQFSDVLDAITLFYIIKQEVQQEMLEEGVEFMDDDDSSDSDEEEYEQNSQDNDGGDSHSDKKSKSSKKGSSFDSSSSDNDSYSGRDNTKSGASIKISNLKKKDGANIDIGSSSNEKDDEEGNESKKQENEQELKKQKIEGSAVNILKDKKDKALKIGSIEMKKISVIKKKGMSSMSKKQSDFESKFHALAQDKRAAEQQDKSILVQSLHKKEQKRASHMIKANHRQDATLRQEELAEVLGSFSNKNAVNGLYTNSNVDPESLFQLNSKDNLSELESKSSGQNTPGGLNKSDDFFNQATTGIQTQSANQEQQRDGRNVRIQKMNTIAKMEQELASLSSDNRTSTNHNLQNFSKSFIGTQVDVINEEDEFEEVDEILRHDINDQISLENNQKGHIDAIKRRSTLQHIPILTNKLKDSLPTSLDHSRSEVLNDDSMQIQQIPPPSSNLPLDSAVFTNQMSPGITPPQQREPDQVPHRIIGRHDSQMSSVSRMVAAEIQHFEEEDQLSHRIIEEHLQEEDQKNTAQVSARIVMSQQEGEDLEIEAAQILAQQTPATVAVVLNKQEIKHSAQDMQEVQFESD